MPPNRSEESTVTAISLFSGGLDSRLAAKLMLQQGLNLIALHFCSVFVSEKNAPGVSDIQSTAEEYGMPLINLDISDDMIELIKEPEHGFGSGLNPCIDCRILQLQKAKGLMNETEAQFLVTGEVVGQRPMTQQKAMMRHIQQRANVAGLVLRPLSALLLDPTIPEQKGLVDRNRLCGFSGRQRTPQIELAEKLEVHDYPAPAGGCRLTEPGYARRLEDIMKCSRMNRKNIELLLLGRHFRIDSDTKLIVGRDEKENGELKNRGSEADLMLECAHYPGPTSLLMGCYCEKNVQLAASITARYGKAKNLDRVEIKSWGRKKLTLEVQPAKDENFAGMML